MIFVRRFHLFLGALLLWLLGPGVASAQWLVYELRFTPEAAESVNFSFYTGAYLVVPVSGGASTIVLTTEEGGRSYAVSEGGGKFFVALNSQVKKAVFSAAAFTGSSQALYSASGHLKRSLLLRSPSGERTWRVAEKLSGRLMATDDEAGMTPAADGSLGMVGSALIAGSLREDLTANATMYCSNLAAATDYITGLLDKYGYTAENRPALETQIQPAEAQDAPANTAAPAADDGVIDPSLFPVESRGKSPETP